MNKAELKTEIKSLLKERKGILLAHYYQREEVQEIADFVGDSLALSIEAAKTDAELIVFAGVHFMAESASILSPEKTVLLPREDAGCGLADMITVEGLQEAREDHPGAAVVTYVNSSAAIKAVSDICCTSANALKVVNSLTDAREVIMAPDGNLARYVARFTDKTIIPWDGYCPVHHSLRRADVLRIKEEHPGAPLASHPECALEILDISDFVGSTAAILGYAGESHVREMIVGTESGIMVELKRRYPEKCFIPAADGMVCETMKYTTLEDIWLSLTQNRTVISVPESLRRTARLALNRMLAAS
ncbi:MAG: quinolinate synthase NadA [Syntrophales bacterium]|nr:quinolinate synthase NadA [Syntrophales bacterium]